VLAEVDQLHLGRQSVGHHVGRGCRGHHLATMCQRHETGCSIDRWTEVVPVALLHLAAMQAHANPDDCASRPCLAGQRQLGVHSRRDGVTSAGEGHREPIPASREDIAAVRLHRRPEQLVMPLDGCAHRR
jgi:hypothetical protein